MRRIALIAATSALVTLVAADAQAQELGRLFLTPEQRAALEARRKARMPDKPAAVATEFPLTRVDGSVRRPAGKSTVWLNGEAIPEGSQPDGARLMPPRSGKGEVSLTVGEPQRRFDLRVGETLDRGSGEVRDVIGGGKIRIKPDDARSR